MPRTFGDSIIHVSHCDALVEGHEELPELKRHILTETESTIGTLIADNLVADGATLQMGIIISCVNTIKQSHVFCESTWILHVI